MAAKNLIKKLNNPLLMGHVNAQKYLHPTKYRSKYVELLQWMQVRGPSTSQEDLLARTTPSPPKLEKSPKPSGQRLWGSGTVSEGAVEPWVARIKKDLHQREKEQRRINGILGH